MRDWKTKLKKEKLLISLKWNRVRFVADSVVKRISDHRGVDLLLSSMRKSGVVMSKKWKRACFLASVVSGTAIARFSGNKTASKVFSVLGVSAKKKEIRGEDVEMIEIDASRRTFLKYAFFGGAVLVAGKYINPLVNLIRGDTVLSERTFENFKITETGRKLLVTDDDGSEILTIDKESF